VTIIESRITQLAYAPEIARAMLQRQQATAVVAARQLIVEGAVGMVETAIEGIEGRGIGRLGQAERSALVSNPMVVLCGEGGERGAWDRPARPRRRQRSRVQPHDRPRRGSGGAADDQHDAQSASGGLTRRTGRPPHDASSWAGLPPVRPPVAVTGYGCVQSS